MTEDVTTDACPACRAIDRADGAEDGWLVPRLRHKVRNENRLADSLKRTQDRVADGITGFAGSLNFVYLHSIWFGVWILLNIGLVGAALEFDRYPFGLLTMIVSLEAIFLSTFVMVSQNRQALRTEVRSQLDFEANLRSEVWATHIGQRLGIDPEHVEAVVAKVIAQAAGLGGAPTVGPGAFDIAAAGLGGAPTVGPGAFDIAANANQNGGTAPS